MKRLLLTLLVLLNTFSGIAQKKNVLFIGNSYTYENNLPQMVADLAASTSDTLLFDSNLIGGATFYSHSINTVTLNKIMAGNWDYVILQGQSLEMFGIYSDILATFPEVQYMDNVINVYNDCAETMLYMTWGRKNGMGAYSYEQMDSMINVNYRKMADSLNGVVSPVGAVWKYIRENNPSIELYQPDESHPSVAGSFAAACSFYAAIFRKDPTLCSFNHSLSVAEASYIKSAAKTIVYDSLMKWHIGEYDSLFIGCQATGIIEHTPVQQHLFPNPVKHTLSFSQFADHSGADIYNQAGERIRIIGPGIREISVSDLPDGLYLVHFKNNIILKFIKLPLIAE